MKILFIISLALTLFICGQKEKRITENKTVVEKKIDTISVDTSSIAIIPFDTSYYWMFKNAKSTELTVQDIYSIEKILNEFIQEYNPEQERQYNKINKEHPEYNLKLKHFIIELNRYKRHYVAVINDIGEKEVWINCFCDTWETDWRKELIEVEDGGNCYFNLKINLTKEKYYDLMVNGDA